MICGLPNYTVKENKKIVIKELIKLVTSGKGTLTRALTNIPPGSSNWFDIYGYETEYPPPKTGFPTWFNVEFMDATQTTNIHFLGLYVRIQFKCGKCSWCDERIAGCRSLLYGGHDVHFQLQDKAEVKNLVLIDKWASTIMD